MENWTTTPFEPLAGLAGGLLIGSSVVLLLYTLGRIAAGAITQNGIERYWRLAFLAGIVLSAVLYMVFVGDLQIQTQMSSTWLVMAGLLVGFGTRLGSGCTSGHGVAGLSRLSPRSIVATLTFMAAAIVTTNIIRHL
ncbi:conserved membrane hypothetical protein [Alteromonas alvinellae]